MSESEARPVRAETDGDDPVAYVFIPADQAATCADCGGYFLHTRPRCPGCGSEHWILARRDAQGAA